MGDKEDGDRLKEKVAEIRWLISTVGHAEQEVREVLGKAIGRLNILKGQVTVRMGVACRRYIGRYRQTKLPSGRKW